MKATMELRSEEAFCRKALGIAHRSFLNGNLPFGCLLTDNSGSILLEAENTIITTHDSIAHCEINLVHAFAAGIILNF